MDRAMKQLVRSRFWRRRTRLADPSSTRAAARDREEERALEHREDSMAIVLRAGPSIRTCDVVYACCRIIQRQAFDRHDRYTCTCTAVLIGKPAPVAGTRLNEGLRHS